MGSMDRGNCEPVEPSEEDPVQDTIWDAADEFRAATFSSLHGYYRPSVGCLRNVLEIIAVGMYCQICGQKEEYDRWRAGEITIAFGRACDLLVLG